MEFSSWYTMYSDYKANNPRESFSWEEYYGCISSQRSKLLQANHNLPDNELAELRADFHTAMTEAMWYEHKRPYYKVYPKLVPYLQKLDLSVVKVEDLNFEFDCINLQFSTDNPLRVSPLSVRDSCFEILSIMLVSPGSLPGSDEKVVLVLIRGQQPSDTKQYSNMQAKLSSRSGDNIAECLEAQKHLIRDRGQFDNDAMVVCAEQSLQAALAVCCGAMLLSRDTDGLFEPDVLSKDMEKYLNTLDPKYVDKAHRRGKVGWTLGREMEVSPHYRHGHFVWLKEGVANREKGRFVWRKGHIVKREFVKKMPTGYLDTDKSTFKEEPHESNVHD